MKEGYPAADRSQPLYSQTPSERDQCFRIGGQVRCKCQDNMEEKVSTLKGKKTTIRKRKTACGALLFTCGAFLTSLMLPTILSMSFDQL